MKETICDPELEPGKPRGSYRKEEKTSKFLIKKSKFLILCIKDAQTTIFFKKKMQIMLLIHSFNKYLLSVYCTSTVPGAKI